MFIVKGLQILPRKNKYLFELFELVEFNSMQLDIVDFNERRSMERGIAYFTVTYLYRSGTRFCIFFKLTNPQLIKYSRWSKPCVTKCYVNCVCLH